MVFVEQTGPGVEQLHGIRSTVDDLVGQQVPHDVAQAQEEAHGGLRVSMHLRAGVDELLVPRAAGDQVHPNGPWTSCKTEPCNVPRQHVRQRRKGVGGPWGVRPCLKFRPCLDVIEGEGRDANAAAVLDLVAKGRKRGEDVAEHDGGIELRVPLDRLCRDGGAQVEVLAAFPEIGLFRQSTVLWKMTSGLPHEPHRRSVNRFVAEGRHHAFTSVH